MKYYLHLCQSKFSLNSAGGSAKLSMPSIAWVKRAWPRCAPSFPIRPVIRQYTRCGACLKKRGSSSIKEKACVRSICPPSRPRRQCYPLFVTWSQTFFGGSMTSALITQLVGLEHYNRFWLATDSVACQARRSYQISCNWEREGYSCHFPEILTRFGKLCFSTR